MLGSALSAHTVEGRGFDCDWWRWEQRPGRIPQEANAAVAADHYERFEADVDLARQFGLRAHLFTVEWSRIQPAPDTFDEPSIAHYEAVVDALTARGIEPVCVLHHVTVPSWFAEQGGWSHPEAPDLFSRYAERMARHLGPKCRWWIPIHEPVYALSTGLIEGLWPPGLSQPWHAARALRHVLHAHAKAYRAIHDHRADALVGASLRARLFSPLDAYSAWDVRTARREGFRYNHLYLRALAEGRSLLLRRADPHIARSVDFIGVSYRGSETVHFSAFRPLRLCAALTDPPGARLPAPKPQPDARGFSRVLDELGRYGLPILVTGNGVATDDDGERCRFLLDHLGVVLDCLKKGIDIRGYLHYALLDGFEWHDGYTARYGLFHVDRETLVRTPNNSAYLYKDVCEHRELRPGAIERFCPGWRFEECGNGNDSGL